MVNARLGLNDSPLLMDLSCGMSALHAAALHGDDTLMNLLVHHPAVTPEVLTTHVTMEGHSVLDIVLSHKNREAGVKIAQFMGLSEFEAAANDGKLASQAYVGPFSCFFLSYMCLSLFLSFMVCLVGCLNQQLVVKSARE